MPDLKFSFCGIDIAAAVRIGGGMHGAIEQGDGTQEALCVYLGSRESIPATYAMTKHYGMVTCQQCLEWLHA